MISRKKLFYSAVIVLCLSFIGWGSAQNAPQHFNSACSAIIDQYGSMAARVTPVRVIQNHKSGLTPAEKERLASDSWQALTWQILCSRNDVPDPENVIILPVTPDAVNYGMLIERGLHIQVKVVVECSGLDSWHTTPQGWKACRDMQGRMLRVVIFDGGHHLPTLALEPDLIIIPELRGYAVHGYMKDAMPVAAIQQILREEKINCPVVAVPRWALVKTPSSMSRITARALIRLPAGNRRPEATGEIIAPRMTRFRNSVFIYLGNDNIKTIARLKDQLDPGKVKIYAAFNYNTLSLQQGESCLEDLRNLGFEVVRVNRPLDAAGVLLRGGL